MSFSEYIYNKKIDEEAFRKGEPDQWKEFKHLFEQVHPASFIAQKLFLINQIRRKFPLLTAQVEEQEIKRQVVKPKLKPRPKPTRK